MGDVKRWSSVEVMELDSLGGYVSLLDYLRLAAYAERMYRDLKAVAGLPIARTHLGDKPCTELWMMRDIRATTALYRKDYPKEGV